MTLQLRDATPDDIPALALLHVQTFNESHRDGQSGGPSYELREQQWRESFKSDSSTVFCVVIEQDGDQLVGFAKGTRHDGGVPGFIGELNKIYLLRRVQRQGLGRRLVGAAAERFRNNGVHSMLLFGDAQSHANGFYEALGGERIYAADGAFHGAYGWRDLELLVAKCRKPQRAD